jgi:hypothetical protein
MAAKSMFEKCQKHEVDAATRDLQAIDKHSFIEKDNMKFTDHKSYSEHHLNNPSLRPYLQNTKITQKLDEIYKHEDHQAKEMQQEHELQKTKEHAKTLEKEYTMHGPKL